MLHTVIKHKRYFFISCVILCIGTILVVFYSQQSSKDIPIPPDDWIEPYAYELNPSVTADALPEGIHPGQIYKIITVMNATRYALVLQRSINFPLEQVPINLSPTFVGILSWNDETQTWEPFLQIQDIVSSDKNISTIKSNPVDLFFSKEYEENYAIPFRIAIHDTDGAGSGEGIMRVMAPQDSSRIPTWKVVDCYYYALDIEKRDDVLLTEEQCDQRVTIQNVSPTLCDNSEQEKPKTIWNIKKVERKSNGSVVITYDEATLYTGRMAEQQSQKETGNPPYPIVGCVSYLNNGFYISNDQKTLHTAILSKDALITTVDENSISVEKFESLWNHTDAFVSVGKESSVYWEPIKKGDVLDGLSYIYLP